MSNLFPFELIFTDKFINHGDGYYCFQKRGGGCLSSIVLASAGACRRGEGVRPSSQVEHTELCASAPLQDETLRQAQARIPRIHTTFHLQNTDCLGWMSTVIFNPPQHRILMQTLISKLVEGQTLTRQEGYQAIQTIMRGDATDAQIAAFLTALRLQGETPEVVAGAAEAMREAFTPVATIHGNPVDTCGTGGDGAHTFNISTTAAFVTAGAGVPVAKHGNRSVSSKSGSADVLTALGVDIRIPAEKMAACLDAIGIAFLFAPSLHPAMKHAIGPRKEIGIRTLFNILGPLSNPASTKRGVLGVYSQAVADLVADALAGLDTEHLFVVHGDDGLDEITITGATHVAEVQNGTVKRYTICPENFGLKRAEASTLVGGTPEENAEITRSILNGEPGPRRDIVLMNAGAAICAGGKASDLAEGVQKAAIAVDSGAAREKLDDLIQQTTA